LSHDDCLEALSSFLDEGLLTEILSDIKSGKEATVWCCRGGPSLGGGLVAAKVYRPIESRRFRNDAVYQEGRLHMARDSRVRRAVLKGSRFGVAAHYATWLDQEWEMMNVLHGAGADVPQPIARNDRAVLMEFIGDETAPAPLLHEVRPDRPAAAAAIVDRLLWNVELMLDLHCVHGDLSPFNILYHGGRAVIIDFPQAVDPRLNRAACDLLARDVDRLCAWARRCGAERDARRIAGRLWRRFREGQIG
jgi:RIO kinase 1